MFHFTAHQIQWHFIPPHSPNFGGLRETGVKSVKSLLTKTIADTLFTYEQYETVLVKIEACLNSRPITRQSSDPNDLNALTPGHFLVGGSLTAISNPDLSSIPINRLKYWQSVTHKMQDFCKKWQNEYLNTLQQRHKWKTEKDEIKIGDVVLIKEDNCPPLHWPIGQITEIHPGSDGIVRVVTVRMRPGPFDDLKSKKDPRTSKLKNLRGQHLN